MSSKPEPRVVDGRCHDFFIVDNPVVDQKIDLVEAKRRADAGWIYTVLCRLANNRTGQATLKIAYLEQKTGRSRPVIIEALKELVRVGLVGISRNREGGKQGASTYTILQVSRVNPGNTEQEVQSKNIEGSELTGFTAYKDSSTKTNSSEPKGSSGADAPEASPEEKPNVAHTMLKMTIDRVRLRGFEPSRGQISNWAKGWSDYVYVKEGSGEDPPDADEQLDVLNVIEAAAAGKLGKTRFFLSVPDAAARVRGDVTPIGSGSGRSRAKRHHELIPEGYEYVLPENVRSVYIDEDGITVINGILEMAIPPRPELAGKRASS